MHGLEETLSVEDGLGQMELVGATQTGTQENHLLMETA